MELSHINEKGYAKMVDVGAKEPTYRVAKAHAKVITKKEVIELLKKDSTPKGNVLNTALVAGISAGKKTSELIPMCHNLPLDKIDIEFNIHDCGEIEIFSTASCFGKTGVEMEALTSVTVAALTIYDMLKAVDKSMEITEIFLIEKTGGKSGIYRRK